jgi:hypothetical protein
MSHCNDDEEAKNFYADDQVKLDSIKRVAFEPIKPNTPYTTPTWPPVEWYWFFYRLWHHNISYWPSQLRDGCVNMWNWFATIWSLRNWDDYHLYFIMLKQMKEMQVGCRANSLEAPHHAALDRCVVLLEEVLKRGQCDCSTLDTVHEDRSPEQIHARVQHCSVCYAEQQAMLEEFGQLFAAFSRNWWD